jgi:hypothetical protein
MNWLLSLLETYYRRKSYRKNKGVLIGWIVYRPEQQKPNVYYNLHPDIKHDEYLKPRFAEIADHLRKYYGDWKG